MATLPGVEPVIKNKNRPHWTVLTNYRFRVLSFAVCFVIICVHVWGKNNGPVFWGLLALQYLVYPHLAFWRARRASNSQQAEVNNLVIDVFLNGIWIAYIEFPLWSSFGMLLTCAVNLAISLGIRGIALAFLAFAGGVLISILLFGLRLSLETGLPVTLMSMGLISGYLLAISSSMADLIRKLQRTREDLRLGEQALSSTNETLQRQLVEVQSLQAKLTEQVIRDPLTGLYNRRYLDSIVARELARCEREAKHLSIMMVDVDHFKKVNDTYGHQGGDEVLKKLATFFQEKVRASDVACRYGGEEFLILLPNMSPDIAFARANNWRAEFERICVMFGDIPIRATLSIGIASYPHHGETADLLTRNADEALYQAKSEGRNRVVLFGKTGT